MGTTASDGSQLVTPVNIPIHPVQLTDINSLGINSTQIGTTNANNQFLNVIPPDAGNSPIGWGGPFINNNGDTRPLFVVDTTGFSGIAVQIVSNAGGNVITFEHSIDGLTWVATSGSQNAGNTSYTTAYSNVGVYVFICAGRYFRARISTYNSGTTTVFYNLRQNTINGVVPLVGSSQSGQGALPVSLIAGSTGGATYTHIAAGQATTVIKNSPGVLFSISLNTQASATNTTIVYDNASTSSALIIASPNCITAPIGTEFQYGGAYGISATIGITIITATANGGDMTVAWK